jgi:hypothetical protein
MHVVPSFFGSRPRSGIVRAVGASQLGSVSKNETHGCVGIVCIWSLTCIFQEGRGYLDLEASSSDLDLDRRS